MLLLPRRHSFYLSAPMLPTILTAPMMPMRLYLGKVLESCLRITMCMSSWGGRSEVSDEVNEKNEEPSL